MSEFQRPTYTKEQIAEAAVTVLKYIEGASISLEGFFPSDVAEALDMDFWLVQDVFTVLVEQDVFEKPTFEPGLCPHPSFAIVVHTPKGLEIEPGMEVVGDDSYTLHCYECGEALPFNFYTEEEWKALGKEQASNTTEEI